MSEAEVDELTPYLQDLARNWLTQVRPTPQLTQAESFARREWLLQILGAATESDSESEDYSHGDKENVGPHGHEVQIRVDGELRTVQCSDPSCPLWLNRHVAESPTAPSHRTRTGN